MPPTEFHFLCGSGESCGSCMYACFCPICALASAKSKLDSSTCCFNCMCVSPAATRWMARTAYGVPGSACDDCITTACCLPCSANQVLQLTETNPPIPHTRPNDIVRHWDADENQCDCGNCLYAFCCTQCAIASASSTATGMPWCFAFCFMNLCSARNMIRVHNRIRGDDIWEECVLPLAVYYCGSCIVSFIPGCVCCAMGPAIYGCTKYVMQMLSQATMTPMEGDTGYLSNYKPPGSTEIELVGRNPPQSPNGTGGVSPTPVYQAYGSPNQAHGAPNVVYGAPNQVYLVQPYGVPNQAYGSPHQAHGAPPPYSFHADSGASAPPPPPYSEDGNIAMAQAVVVSSTSAIVEEDMDKSQL